MRLEWLSTSRVLGSNLHSITVFIYTFKNALP